MDPKRSPIRQQTIEVSTTVNPPLVDKYSMYASTLTQSGQFITEPPPSEPMKTKVSQTSKPSLTRFTNTQKLPPITLNQQNFLSPQRNKLFFSTLNKSSSLMNLRFKHAVCCLFYCYSRKSRRRESLTSRIQSIKRKSMKLSLIS